MEQRGRRFGWLTSAHEIDCADALPNRFVTVWQCMQAQSLQKDCARGIQVNQKSLPVDCDIIVRPRSKAYGATSFHIRWELSWLCRMSRARLASSENGAEGQKAFLVNLNASIAHILLRIAPNRFVTVWQCMQAQSLQKDCARGIQVNQKSLPVDCDIIVRPRSKAYGATSFHIRWELSRLCRMSRARLASSENGAEG